MNLQPSSLPLHPQPGLAEGLLPALNLLQLSGAVQYWSKEQGSTFCYSRGMIQLVALELDLVLTLAEDLPLKVTDLGYPTLFNGTMEEGNKGQYQVNKNPGLKSWVTNNPRLNMGVLLIPVLCLYMGLSNSLINYIYPLL